MGRKRIQEDDKKKTITINLKQKVITEIEKEGIPKKVIEDIITHKFTKE